MSGLKKLVLGALAAAAMAYAAPASAADQIYEGEYVDGAAICAAPSVLTRIKKNFRYQVTHVPHLPDVEITDFRRIHQHRYIPSDGLDRPIARRYCGATVELSDGDRRDIWYLIEERMGFATLLDGIGHADAVRGSNVEFCVAGFDRWNVYNGACRVLR
jgi:hypothetical protein